MATKKELMEEAQKELTDERQEEVKEQIKDKLREIEEGKRILAILERQLTNLMEEDEG